MARTEVHNTPSSIVYMDESGCAGFQFDTGSSRFLTVALVLPEDEDELRQAVMSFRKSLGWAEHREFHFVNTSDKIREGFFHAIASSRFSVRALVVDKSVIMPKKPNEFYEDVTTAVLNYAYEQLTNATVIIDEPKQTKQKQAILRAHIRKALNATRGITVRTVRCLPSHTDDLLQVADMVCGAIHRRRERGEDRFRAIIAHRITDEQLWGFGD